MDESRSESPAEVTAIASRAATPDITPHQREPFLPIGRGVARHPWWVLAAWLVAILLGAWGEHRLGRVTLGVEGGVPGSASKRAADALRTEFNNPFIDPLVVGASAPHLTVDAPPYSTWLEETRRTIAALPGIRRIASYADERDAALRSTDGRVTLLLVGPAGTTHSDRQQTVIALRVARAPRRSRDWIPPHASRSRETLRPTWTSTNGVPRAATAPRSVRCR